MILFPKKFLLALVVFSTAISAQQPTAVLPQPKQISYSGEKLDLQNAYFEILALCKDYIQIKTAAAELDSVLSKMPAEEAGKKIIHKIIFGIPSENKKMKSLATKYGLEADTQLGDEAYKLLITKDELIISANNQKGVFYGIQTLIQLLREGARNGFLPAISIADWPTLKMRAVMDDISRGPMPTMDFMKYQIRRLAAMKVNALFHYVEHVVRTKSHPEFAPPDGSFTIDEWKEISDYALSYNITVIGGFQSFGHFNNILKTPQYAHLGESGSLISPVKPESYKFLEDIFAEMMPAFHSEYFNINCDETFDLGKEDSKALVDSLGYAEVYYRHIMKLYDIVKKYGKKTIMWGDIVLQYPELLKKLPRDILIGTWTYDALDSYKDFIEPIRDAGFKFIVVPGVLNSSKIFPNFIQSFGNIRNFALDAERYGAFGLLNTVWDDGGNAFFSNDWYGVAYGADKSWNPDSDDSASFDSRFSAALYDAGENSYAAAIRKLNELAGLEATDGMTDKVLFAKLIPLPGEKFRISVKGWEEVIRIADEASGILSNFKPGINKNDADYTDFVINIYKTLAEERFSLLSAAKNYMLAGSLAASSPFDARKCIVKALSEINGIILREEKLLSVFEELWLSENHTYAMNVITEKYREKISEFADVRLRLLSSLKNFDEGKKILSADSVRLSISELPGKYFREWMMIEPLPNADGAELSRMDYLADMGGEKSAAPKVTQEFFYGSSKYRWRRVVTDQPDAVDLSKIFPDGNGAAVMYAAAFIDAETDTIVNASAGFRGGVEIFVNGLSVFEKISKEFSPDQFSFTLPLRKGRNNILLKITGPRSDWGFTFRLPECEVRNSKNRYRIVNQ